MNVIILSGGSGKRLWPLSNEIRSKQFIKFFKNENGEQESMVQRVYRQIQAIDPNSSVTIATSKSQVSSIRNQLGDKVNISVEPSRRDTFPAIVLAVAYLHDVLRVDPTETVLICPVDPYVDECYFEKFKELEKVAKTSSNGLVLMGIEPTYPSEKYGYILPETTNNVSLVKSFKEKPNREIAQKYINEGGLWNSGVFVLKIGHVLERAHQLIDFTDYDDLLSKYSSLEKISFDYAFVEHEPIIQVVRFDGEWKDIGTWNTLSEAVHESTIGPSYVDDCENIKIINELDIPVVAEGLKDVIIAASPEGILVSDKEKSSYIKPIVDRLDYPVMFAEKSWGDYQIIDIEPESLTIKVTLNAGNKMKYHRHFNRSETWNIISGKGFAILDDEVIKLNPGDILQIPSKCFHTVLALTDLKLIEVQSGLDISVEDKEKKEMPSVMDDLENFVS